MMRSQLVPKVAACAATQSAELLYTTEVCQVEVLAGIEILPDRRRRVPWRGLARCLKTTSRGASPLRYGNRRSLC